MSSSKSWSFLLLSQPELYQHLNAAAEDKPYKCLAGHCRSQSRQRWLPLCWKRNSICWGGQALLSLPMSDTQVGRLSLGCLIWRCRRHKQREAVFLADDGQAPPLYMRGKPAYAWGELHATQRLGPSAHIRRYKVGGKGSVAEATVKEKLGVYTAFPIGKHDSCAALPIIASMEYRSMACQALKGGLFMCSGRMWSGGESDEAGRG